MELRQDQKSTNGERGVSFVKSKRDGLIFTGKVVADAGLLFHFDFPYSGHRSDVLDRKIGDDGSVTDFN